MIRHFISFFILISIIAGPKALLAGNDKVAKVIILRGTVKASHKSGKDFFIEKKGAWLREGTSLETSKKSFIKLLFIDKSQMNLGPNSKMVITQFPKKKAGIIILIKGQLRSKVSKDYMGIQNKNQSKLFIKTRTAAMGVRGTDFQVNYNPINQATSLLTFEGSVAMAQINETIKGFQVNQQSLEKIVSSDQAVIVKQGQFSGTSNKQSRVTSPVKINPAQLKVLEKNSSGINSPDKKPDSKKEGPKKSFRNPIPPGVNAKAFANNGASVDKALKTAIGTKAMGKVLKKINRSKINAPKVRDSPEGRVNRVTGEVRPAAGGYIDMKTALYIPPPPGSAYDATTETYIPPPSFGSFNAKSGEYTNDKYTFTDDGTFKVKENIKEEKRDGRKGRSPAATEGKTRADKKRLPPPKVIQVMPKMNKEFIDRFGNLIDSQNNRFIDPEELTEEAININTENRDILLDRVNNSTGSQVEFIFK